MARPVDRRPQVETVGLRIDRQTRDYAVAQVGEFLADEFQTGDLLGEPGGKPWMVEQQQHDQRLARREIHPPPRQKR